MSYCIRPMRRSDIPQVKVIDREAFPTMLPPPNFERELRNKMTRYYVACDEDRIVKQETTRDRRSAKNGVAARIRHWFSGGDERDASDTDVEKTEFVCGYVGFWIMADEAHITAIAVKEDEQRKGVGELLMMTVNDCAKRLSATTLTLEVRVSNTGAQKLYEKYGFKQAGVRKHYYTDNREDAYIMTTDDITSVDYIRLFESLKTRHASRWGDARFILSCNW